MHIYSELQTSKNLTCVCLFAWYPYISPVILCCWWHIAARFLVQLRQPLSSKQGTLMALLQHMPLPVQ